MQLLEVRTALSRAEDNAGWREDSLRQEIQVGCHVISAWNTAAVGALVDGAGEGWVASLPPPHQALQARLQAQEARAEELRGSTEEATRPLLRQLDALQAQMASNSRTWQTVEDK